MRPPIPGLRPSLFDDVCWQCTRRALRQSQSERCPSSIRAQALVAVPAAPSTRRHFSKISLPRATTSSASVSASPTAPAASFPRQPFRAGYFLSNSFLSRINGSGDTRGLRSSAALPTTTAASLGAVTDTPRHAGSDSTTATATAPDNVESETTLLPHRRRQAARRNAALSQTTTAAVAAAKTTSSTVTTLPSDSTKSLPPDASSILAGVAASHPANSFRRQLSAMLSLSKPRLTVLVVLSAMVPYALYPVPAFLTHAALDAPSLSPLTLLFLTTGTTLCSASANALNMLYEPDTDSKMSRTRARPLVRKLLTTRAAVLFAVGCGLAGTGALFLGVNPTVAFLGALNIALYAGIYTPMKRISAVNTWIGAIVGGIPPLMGWAAAAGESATADGTWRELLFAADGSSIGGWLFAGILFAWQFPHFMPLSWGIKEEYKAAGLRMLAWTNPARNGRVALRYSLVFVPLCIGLCAAGITEWTFVATSLPVNLWLIRESIKFWRLEGLQGSAKGLFWASVWHLPVVMVLALAQKKGMWTRVWRSVVGQPLEDDDDEDGEWEEDTPISVVAAARR
ncbi:UbiA prenyltransferase family-domain-containing protein [Podospora didyma]|uniref:Protoheme IX farnesyltransferase, mitochondrial n=1 Tax=Podospora didyma TaxID=330526 RepID=A0AAE0NQ26_9PEZI|nr:UbiA prenyltransferase family-domain-containing protein [Podospora didyma]